MARESELAEIDADTIEALREAKTKPRCFLLICKGTQIHHLLVQKKPIKDAQIQAAKRNGFKGIAYTGVVTAEGSLLRFHLAQSDGFEETPKNEVPLKKFLSENEAWKGQVEYVLEAQLPALPADETSAAGDAAASAIPPAPNPPPPPPATSKQVAQDASVNSEKLLAALVRFVPIIEAISEREPERREALTQELQSLQDLVKTEAAENVQADVLEFGKRLKSLLAGENGGAKRGQDAGTLVKLQQARLLWIETRQHLQNELTKLTNAIIEKSKLEPDIKAIQAKSKNLFGMLDSLDTRLIRELDDALNATTHSERMKFQFRAQDVIEEYIEFVDGQSIFKAIDNNGFEPVTIASRLDKTLDSLSKALGAHA